MRVPLLLWKKWRECCAAGISEGRAWFCGCLIAWPVVLWFASPFLIHRWEV